MQSTDERNLRIALQNDGRLTEPSTELLRSVGLDFENHRRRLFTRCRNFELEVLFVRDDDIPEYVQDGVADLGVVGRNVVAEQRARVEPLEELGFGRCTLTLAVPRESDARAPGDLDGRRVVTTHPRTLRRWMERRGLDARIIEIRGAAEIGPALDVADAVCDLVSTGATLRMNDLRPVGDVLESQAVLVARGAALVAAGERSDLIGQLRKRIQALLTAREMKYVTLNAPESALPRIEEILPSMKSPTVVPLAEEGMVALHAAVREETFWEVMEDVREAGGSDILVLPVEKMLP